MWFLKKEKKVQESLTVPDLAICSFTSKSHDDSDDRKQKKINKTSDNKPFFLMDWANNIEPNDLKKVQDALSQKQSTQNTDTQSNDESFVATPTKGLRKNSCIQQTSLRHIFEKSSLESPSCRKIQASISSEEEALRKGKSLNSQSLIYARNGEYLKAIELWTQSLQILVPIYGEFHSEIALIMNNMGIAYNKLNLHEEAMEMLQESLFIRKELYGPYHIDVAATLHNIGNLFLSQGLYKESLNAYLETMDIRIEILGDNHKEVAFSHNGVGHVYYEMGKYHEAHDEFLEALRITTNAGLSRGNPVVDDTLNGLDMLEDLLLH